MFTCVNQERMIIVALVMLMIVIVCMDPWRITANLEFVDDTILSIDNMEIYDSLTLKEMLHKPAISENQI
ncbi:hypothetical protein X798_04469 [Onchocerca flexuosa]|uniref:Uncharacterized protein n=1 Tax=Onchocerca flexuosa TaxID=387005 RepID=A0A238BV05_9BILA|nr:hypothetical protein X798_04469 [Onchocerca flexuosa]